MGEHIKNDLKILAHTYSYVKLNSKVGLFSSIFCFEGSFIPKNRLLPNDDFWSPVTSADRKTYVRKPPIKRFVKQNVLRIDCPSILSTHCSL